jgi:outer membrane protein TolC
MVWSAIGSITQPLFAGRRLTAEVDRTKAVVEEKANHFGQTLLQALMEVENALVQEKHQKHYLEELELQFENASAALREARSRYLEGLENFLTVLTALQSVQEVEKELIRGQYQLRVYRVQLCRALGGTWTQTLQSPTEQPQTQEVVQ